jgi:hypothetical protein
VIKLSDATNRLLKEAEITDKLFNQGAEVVGGSPEQFAATISREIAQWKKLWSRSGLNNWGRGRHSQRPRRQREISGRACRVRKSVRAHSQVDQEERHP